MDERKTVNVKIYRNSEGRTGLWFDDYAYPTAQQYKQLGREILAEKDFSLSHKKEEPVLVARSYEMGGLGGVTTLVEHQYLEMFSKGEVFISENASGFETDGWPYILPSDAYAILDWVERHTGRSDAFLVRFARAGETSNAFLGVQALGKYKKETILYS